MTNPTIDLVVPYFGKERYLIELVESIIAQTYTNWKLYIIDDNVDKDKSSKLDSLLQDKRIQYFKNETNLGLIGNSNKAISLATNEWVELIGSDDVLKKNHLQEFVSVLQEENNNIDIYHPKVKVIDSNSRIIFPLPDKIKNYLSPKTRGVQNNNDLITSLSKGQWTIFNSMIWRTSVLKDKPINEEFPIGYEVPIIFRLLIKGVVFYYNNEETFKYRRIRTSVSNSSLITGKRFVQEKKFYTEFSMELEKHNYLRASGIMKRRTILRLNALLWLFKSLLEKDGNPSLILKTIFS